MVRLSCIQPRLGQLTLRGTAVSLSQPLCSAPEGVLLSNLTEVGAYGATPLYDDLLIAKPNHPDSSWHRYLGTYPHSDTVLMGITPKRAGLSFRH